MSVKRPIRKHYLPKFVPVIALLILSQSAPQFCLAQEATDEQSKGSSLLAATTFNEPSGQRLESLTKQIARKETELLRLNTNFRIECTRVSKWKPRRLFLYNLAASGTSNAGIDSIAASRWNYASHPKAMTRTTAIAGPICLLVGHCITLGGVMTESTLDLINDYKVRKKGLDPKSSRTRVLAIKADLDKLIAERNDVLSQGHDLSAADLELAQSEGAVLKDVRDLSLSEYSQFYVRANKFFANRDTNSVMAATAACTGGFQGSLLGIISADKRQPRLVYPGGVGFVISGATIAATPLATRLMANLRGSLARHDIAPEIDNISTSSVSQLDTDRLKLEQLLAQSNHSQNDYFANISKRAGAYSKQSELLAAQNQMNSEEKTLSNKEFLERMFFATCIGGSKMSWGINLAHAGYLYHPRSVLKLSKSTVTIKVTNKVTGKIKSVVTTKVKVTASPDPAPGKLFTERVAIGATSYIPGTSLWILDTLQNRVRGEARNHALATQSHLPAALLKERMDRVEQIDGAFNY